MNQQKPHNGQAEGVPMYLRFSPEKLAFHMNRLGMNQMDVAREISKRCEALGLKLSPSSVGGWVRGANRPHADYVANLALILRCKIDDLYDTVQ